ncbi:hypothetical protein F511_17787 [Dorcoceras hygrometricum]|uniref:Uncharacterized protein n=1 Tax=Dorcoceras hygrometricum TaxID=472368 RepID=A0A2Z7ATE9_9LAMI|nr:hypothetical protein F511_17787 [Dorcoceras hygrometricum]
MVKRKAIEAVEMELQERTFGNNRVNHAPSHSDVVAAFSISPCEDACEMLTPTDAELLSAHYISGDFVVSNECAVTRRMSELMSWGLKVVCSQRCLSPSHDGPSHDSPPPQTPPHRSPPPQTTPQTPPHRSPPPQTPPHQTPPHRSPPPQTPHHASPSRPQRLEERMTVLEAQMAMMMQEQANMMDILKSLQSDMLSFKRAQSPVITIGGETAEGAETWTGSPEVAGWIKEARMSRLTPVQEEESGSRESTPEAEGAQVEGNQTEGSTKSIPETAQVEGNQTEGSTKSIPETEGAQVEGNQTEGSTKSIPETEGAQVEGNQTEGSTKSIPETVQSQASFSAMNPVASSMHPVASSINPVASFAYPVDKEIAVARSVVTKNEQQLSEQLLNNLLENIQPFDAINAQDGKNQWLK